MDEEANLFRKDVRDLIGEEVYAAVEEGKFGAVVCNDDKEKHGYYLVEWLGVPWTRQDTDELLCKAVYWNSVPYAPGWYTRSNPPHIETQLLNHIITADLELHPISESNKLPNGCAKASATRKGAMKLDIETHDFIMEEIFRREALEHVEPPPDEKEKKVEEAPTETNSDCNSSISSSSSSSEEIE